MSLKSITLDDFYMQNGLLSEEINLLELQWFDLLRFPSEKIIDHTC